MTELDPHVDALRQVLTENDIYWAPVRDYPKATFVPGDPVNDRALKSSQLTIWWDRNEYLWGHSFEYHDATVEDVITRLKGLKS